MKQFYWREVLENFHDHQLIGDTSVTLVKAVWPIKVQVAFLALGS